MAAVHLLSWVVCTANIVGHHAFLATSDRVTTPTSGYGCYPNGQPSTAITARHWQSTMPSGGVMLMVVGTYSAARRLAAVLEALAMYLKEG